MTTNDLLNVGGEGDATDNLQPNQKPGANPNIQTTPPPASDDPSKAGAGKNANEDFASKWKDYIPDDLKDRSEWSNIKNVEDLYKNYINAQQMISKSVRLPDATSSPEDVAAFYQKMGKPKDKSDYTFEYKPKENYVYTKDSFDFSMFQDIADKANLTKDQYQALASAYIDVNNEQYINYKENLKATAAQELKDAESKLRSAWGTNYQTNINNISNKVKTLYPETTLKRMQNAGLFRDPEFLQAHLKLTKMMTGDTVFIEGNAVENVDSTLSALTEKRDKLMSEDYVKNREQVMSINQQIVKLKQAQALGATKYQG